MILPRPQVASVLSEVGQNSASLLGRVGDELSDHSVNAGLNGAVLFDRVDLRIGAQIIQVILGEFSGVSVDDVELVGDVARGGRDAGLGGANVGSKRHTLLECNNILARDSFLGFGNSKKGGHWRKVP